jgi:hypothetical protein
MKDYLIASMFCGARIVRTLPSGFFFNTEALVLKFWCGNGNEIFRDEQY